MDKRLTNRVTRPGEAHALDKTRIVKTWQQFYEDRGYGL
jgi:hypothetical protein